MENGGSTPIPGPVSEWSAMDTAVVTPSMATTGAATPICGGPITMVAAVTRMPIAAITGTDIPTSAFVPGVYYAPGFYGWAYNPWAAPVAFGWGWGAAPWYGYYGYYFAPAPVYASPAFWITDYLLAANLQAAYEARAAAQGEANADAAAEEQPASGGGAVGLTPEVKQQIADEVRAQIAAQQQEAAHPEPAAPVSSTAPAGEARPAPMKFPPRWIPRTARSSCPRFLVNPHPTEPNVP